MVRNLIMLAFATLVVMTLCAEEVTVMDDNLEHETSLARTLRQEDVMDKAVKLFQRAKQSKSRADLHSLLQSLIQVAEQNAPDEGNTAALDAASEDTPDPSSEAVAEAPSRGCGRRRSPSRGRGR
jgi:hypothetical protein